MRTRLLELARHKASFFARVSHELRTPLNAIIGYSDLLLEEQEGDPAVAADVTRIRRAGTELLALVNDILDLSRAQAHRLTLDERAVELRELIAAVENTAWPLAASNGNRINVRVDAGISMVMADPVRLKQVLLNLVANAAKFTQDGTIELVVTPTDDAVRFTVRDDGIGMTAEQQVRVFEPFVQAEDHTAATYGGTGLGLTITRELCLLMGGTLEVASELGVGTCFEADIPLRAAEPTPAALCS